MLVLSLVALFSYSTELIYKTINFNFLDASNSFNQVELDVVFSKNVLLLSYDLILYNKMQDETLYLDDFIQVSFENSNDLYFRFNNTYIYYYDKEQLYRTYFMQSENYSSDTFYKLDDFNLAKKDIWFLYGELNKLYTKCMNYNSCLSENRNDKNFYKKIFKKIIKVTKVLNAY